MGAGGGSGSDGLGMSTQQPPTPRLSTFLRTFGTSTSTSPDHTTRGYPGVDVVLETRLRERLLHETISGPGAGSSTQSVSCRPGGSGTSTSSGHSSSSSSEKPNLTKHKRTVRHTVSAFHANTSVRQPHAGAARKLTISGRFCHCLLLLAAFAIALLLPLTIRDFAKHHATIAVHEGNTGKTFTILERVAHQRLLWHEGALRHFV